MRPRSGAAVPARMFISVDLPAPLWPTRPRHSPAPMARSTPANARTAPNCFSAPSSRTISAGVSTTLPATRAPSAVESFPPLLLHVGLDGLDRVVLRVFRACHTADRDVGQRRLEGVLGEGEIGHQEVVRDVLMAVEDLL